MLKGPVNKALNLVAAFHGKSIEFVDRSTRGKPNLNPVSKLRVVTSITRQFKATS